MIRVCCNNHSPNLYSRKVHQSNEDASNWPFHRSAQLSWYDQTHCATQIEGLLIYFYFNQQLKFQIGAGLGGVAGLYNGVVATNLAKQTGKLRRTQ